MALGKSLKMRSAPETIPGQPSFTESGICAGSISSSADSAMTLSFLS